MARLRSARRSPQDQQEGAVVGLGNQLDSRSLPGRQDDLRRATRLAAPKLPPDLRRFSPRFTAQMGVGGALILSFRRGIVISRWRGGF
jgi:hypothetical protein